MPIGYIPGPGTSPGGPALGTGTRSISPGSGEGQLLWDILQSQNRRSPLLDVEDAWSLRGMGRSGAFRDEVGRRVPQRAGSGFDQGFGGMFDFGALMGGTPGGTLGNTLLALQLMGGQQGASLFSGISIGER